VKPPKYNLNPFVSPEVGAKVLSWSLLQDTVTFLFIPISLCCCRQLKDHKTPNTQFQIVLYYQCCLSKSGNYVNRHKSLNTCMQLEFFTCQSELKRKRVGNQFQTLAFFVSMPEVKTNLLTLCA